MVINPITNFTLRTKLIFSLIILLMFSVSLSALDPSRKVSQYMFKSWDQADGLPQNTVTAVLQTRDGYIWAGTQEGIARFNGKKFTSFTKDNDPVIKSDYIIALLESVDGTLWAGSREGLLAYRNGKFTCYSKKNGLTNDLIRSLAEDNDGVIWVGTESGLFYKKGLRFKKFEASGSDRVNCLCNDPYNGKVFFGTNNGLFFIKDNIMDNVDLGKTLTANIVRDILVISENEILVATMGSGVARIKDGVMDFTSMEEGLSSSNIVKLIEDSNGNIWAGCDEAGGVNRINKNGIENLTENDGFQSDSVYDFIEDSEGNLWVGNVRGLVRISDGKVKMITTREGLDSNYINPVLVTGDNIYVGTDKGINLINKDIVTSYKKGVYGELKIFSFYQDSSGNLWIGSFGKGVFRDNSAGVKHFTMKDGLPNDTIFSITEDKKGNIWFGTMGGLVSYKDGVFRSYLKDEGLSNLIIYYLMADSRGDLWICTGGGGVDRLSDGKFRNFSAEDGLSDNFAVSLYEDEDKNIWVGTANGLNLIRDDKIFVINKENGLYNNVAFTILEDSKGTFWMSSNKGIYSIQRSDLLDITNGKREKIECSVLTHEDGMSGSECAGGFSPSGWITERGELLIPSPSGLVVIDPEKIRINNNKPPVEIDEVIVDGVLVDHSNGEVNIASDSEKLDIRFSVLSYSTISRNRVSYILEGNDKNWEQLDHSREWMAHYTNLPPGNFKFRVKGANGDGVWNEAGTFLNIYIEPFFWETTWFKGIGLILFSLFSYLIISLLKKYITVLAFWKEKHYIGHYKLIEKIGSGGMGEVYKAKDVLSKDKIYAVKILREDLFGDKEQIQRLKNEGIIIDRLEHEYIVKIFERGEYSGGIYIVMELLSGVPLNRFTGKGNKNSISDIMEIMYQVTDALTFIHGKNITHRDLKPENVMIDRSVEGTLAIKLLDFGLARIDTFTKLTQTGAVMGSIHYLSPEQLTGTGISDKSDIFSAGIIFYELLAGEKPFKGETAVEIMQSILTREPESTDSIREEIPDKVFGILKKMLSKDPRERPSAIELRELFKKYSKQF